MHHISTQSLDLNTCCDTTSCSVGTSTASTQSGAFDESPLSPFPSSSLFMMKQDPVDYHLLVSRLNQLASPFLRLCGELRTQIYGYVFEGTRFPIHHENDIWIPSLEQSPTSLLLVCRQVYAEAALLPYSKGTIAADDFGLFEYWLGSRTVAQVDAISKLEFHCRLFLGGRTITQWTPPIFKDWEGYHICPNLKHVDVYVAVCGTRHNDDPPDENNAQKHIMDLRRSLEKRLPGVELTTAYSPYGGMENRWRPSSKPLTVQLGKYQWWEKQKVTEAS